MRKLGLALVMTWVSVLLCDTVRLRDGQTLEGDLKRVGDGWELRRADGKTITLSEGDVKAVEVKPAAGAGATGTGAMGLGKDEARQRLANLRAGVDGQADISNAIKRYESFIQQAGESAAAEEARRDLAMWQERQANGMVKIGAKWLDQQQVQGLDEKSLPLIEQAKADLKDGRLKEAVAAVEKVLAEDPAHPGALFLKGVALSRQNQSGPARKAFEGAAAAAPNHGPTLNNAAVLQWRTKAYALAITTYERAMTAMPLTPRIHDNIAEVLNALPREVRNSSAAKKLGKHYDSDEPRLQVAMESAGWRRWGSTWVDADQLAELRKQDEEVKAKLAVLATEADTLKREVRTLDDQIAANNRSLGQLEFSRQAQAANPSPQAGFNSTFYWRLRRETDELEARRREAIGKLGQIAARAEQARAELPVAPFTGEQKLMEEEFVPTRPRAVSSAATLPAVEPR